MEDIKLESLFFRTYDVDIVSSNDILIEVYRESEMEEEWEVPATCIGIRIFEDEILKEDIPLHGFGNYGLFSYYAANRHKSHMEFAISVAELIGNVITNGLEMYDMKIKKRFVSESHIYLLNIPPHYDIDMPEPKEQFLKALEFEQREIDLKRKKVTDPTCDISEELAQIQQASYNYLSGKQE